MRLFYCAVLLLMPLALPGSESLLVMFAPGVAACLLFPLEPWSVTRLLGGIFIAGFAGAIWAGKPDAAMWMVQGAGGTFVLVKTLKLGRSSSEIFLSVALFMCLCLFAGFAAGSGLDLAKGYRLVTDGLSRQLDASLDMYLKGSGESGLSPELALWFQQVREVVIRYFPGLVMTTMVAAACINTLILGRCAGRMTAVQVRIQPFSQWRMPEWLVWFWIAAGAACFISRSLYSAMGMNALLVISFIYMISGISTAGFLFERFRLPRWLRWFTWIVVGLQWYGLLLLVALGLSDTWVDFRTRFRADREQE